MSEKEKASFRIGLTTILAIIAGVVFWFWTAADNFTGYDAGSKLVVLIIAVRTLHSLVEHVFDVEKFQTNIFIYLYGLVIHTAFTLVATAILIRWTSELDKLGYAAAPFALFVAYLVEGSLFRFWAQYFPQPRTDEGEQSADRNEDAQRSGQPTTQRPAGAYPGRH